MSNTEKKPIDPFATLSLDKYKRQENKKEIGTKKLSPDKEAIKAIAEQNDFQSRQAPLKKQKIVTKTFSLFQEDCCIISDVLKAYLENMDEGLSQPSGSDVVRAALHILAKKSSQEQAELVKKHRGRGRRS